MNLEQWMVAIKEMYRSHGIAWSDEKEKTLRSEINVPESINELQELGGSQSSYTEDDIKQASETTIKVMQKSGVISLEPLIPEGFQGVYKEAVDVVYRDFFHRATNGITFGDENRIDKAQREIFEEYGATHVAFINMSRAFLTFTAEIKDMFPEYYNAIVAQALNSALTGIKSVFYPSDGPYKIPVSKRIKAQQDILRLYAPAFNREEYFKNNPILNKMKAEESRWPGFVYIVVFLTITWFVPQDVWWGKVLFYILIGMIVICLCSFSKKIKSWIFGKKINGV